MNGKPIRIFARLAILSALGACNVKQFAVIETGRIYSYSSTEKVFEEAINDTTKVRVTTLGRKGQYTFEILDKKGVVVKTGVYTKTHIMREWGQQEVLGKEPKKIRYVYYEPVSTNE